MAETSLQLKVSHRNSGNDDSEIKKNPDLQTGPLPRCAAGYHVHNTAIPQSTTEGSHVYILVNIFSLHLFNQNGKGSSSNFARQ